MDCLPKTRTPLRMWGITLPEHPTSHPFDVRLRKVDATTKLTFPTAPSVWALQMHKFFVVVLVQVLVLLPLLLLLVTILVLGPLFSITKRVAH